MPIRLHLKNQPARTVTGYDHNKPIDEVGAKLVQDGVKAAAVAAQPQPAPVKTPEPVKVPEPEAPVEPPATASEPEEPKEPAQEPEEPKTEEPKASSEPAKPSGKKSKQK